MTEDPNTQFEIWQEEMDKHVAENGDEVAIKFDQDKVRMELLPVLPLEAVARVLTIGARKYDQDNWRKGFDYSRTYGAAQRHLSDWYKGIDLDDDTSENHLAHAICNLMFLLEFEHSGKGNDDRIKQVDKS